MKFLCANDKIDVRQTLQQRGAARLSHASKEPEHYVRSFLRQPPEHAHLAERFLVSHVAHAARIQQDHVGFRLMPDPLVAARHERMRDFFGVALVHLATISLDEEFGHGRARTIHARPPVAKAR